MTSDCMPTILCCTTSADDTRDLGAAVAGLIETGDVIVLVGDLGAGKTAFVQGFARALGVTVPVTSPTFTLANRYTGDATMVTMVVNHLDVYRFNHPDEAHDLALPELLDEGVTLVEWGDTILGLLPAHYLRVTIRFSSRDNDRSLDIQGWGKPWATRAQRLNAALNPWSRQSC